MEAGRPLSMTDGMADSKRCAQAADREFVTQAATAPGVKEFAQRMVRDHANVNSGLQRQGPVSVSNCPRAQGQSTAQVRIDAGQIGDDFEKRLAPMVDEHHRNPQLRAFAGKNLPGLREICDRPTTKPQ